jgi:hypothetical protein
MSGDDIDFVRQESFRVPCITEGIDKTHFYDEDCRGNEFETWMFRQPVFDLKKRGKDY